VTEPEHQLREAFESHERLSPDLGAVYVGTQDLFRRYRRRRRGMLVAGGAVLVAAVLAAGTNLPADLRPGAGMPGPGIDTVPPSAPTPTSLTRAELARDLAAYDNAGYGYDEAVQLAAIWHVNGELNSVKAEAGSLLLAGQTLPVPPHPRVGSSMPDFGASAARDAFDAAGHRHDDAAELARLWTPGRAQETESSTRSWAVVPEM
jgi:hypothetical protein